MSAFGSWIAGQFSSENLFQTIAFFLVVLISLPSLVLDRIIRLFETHRRYKSKYLAGVRIIVNGQANDISNQEAALKILSDYNTVKFVQQRDRPHATRPAAYIELLMRSGEKVYMYKIGQEFDITRTNKSGDPIVTYWGRSPDIFARLLTIEQGVRSVHIN